MEFFFEIVAKQKKQNFSLQQVLFTHVKGIVSHTKINE